MTSYGEAHRRIRQEIGTAMDGATFVFGTLTEHERNAIEWAVTDALTDERLLELADELQVDISPDRIRDSWWHPCDVCQDDIGLRGEWFMVHDHVWEQAGGQRYLCVRCMEHRLGRELTPADFTDAPVNTPNMSTLLLTRLGFCA